MGRIFFLEKPVFFRAKNKTVIRRGPNAILSLLLSGSNPKKYQVEPEKLYIRVQIDWASISFIVDLYMTFIRM